MYSYNFIEIHITDLEICRLEKLPTVGGTQCLSMDKPPFIDDIRILHILRFNVMANNVF